MAILKKNETAFASVPAENLDHFLEENSIDQTKIDVHFTNAEIKIKTRKDIERSAGDQQSILGTTSDTAMLALLGLAAIIEAVEQSQDWDTFKGNFNNQLAQLGHGHDVVTLSRQFLTTLANNQNRFPIHVKGIDTVVADIATRNTAIGEILSNSRT